MWWPGRPNDVRQSRWPYLNVCASGVLEDGGVAVSAVVDDAHLPARAKDPDGFTKCPGTFSAAVDVGEGQAAEHYVEQSRRKGQVSCIGIDELGTLADALGHRVALGGRPAVSRLVTQTPDIGPGRTTPGKAVSIAMTAPALSPKTRLAPQASKSAKVLDLGAQPAELAVRPSCPGRAWC